MRRLLVALALALAAPQALAGEPYATLLDWQHGASPVGSTRAWQLAHEAAEQARPASSPLASSFAFDVDACRRHLLVDLLYEPAEQAVAVEGVGEAALAYDFLVELRRDGALLAERRIERPGYGAFLAEAPEAGAYELRLTLANGALVEWDLRLRGREVFDELACEPRVVVNEVEADPPGADAGAEWVEIYNAGDEEVHLGLWRVRATHGTPAELTLPDVTLAPGARLVAQFVDGQALDNANEVVQLVDAFGRLRDETPPLRDRANDGSTWQRVPDGSDAWSFGPATPGAPNG